MRKRRSRGPFCFADFGEDVEQLRVGLVADGVDGNRQARRVGRPGPGLRIASGCGDVDAGVLRIADVRLEHLGGAGAERAVHEALDAADADAVVAEVLLGHAEAIDFLVSRDRPAQIDPDRSACRRARVAARRGTACGAFRGSLPSMSWTLVTPTSAQRSSRRARPRRSSSSSGLGDEPADEAHRVVLRRPVGVLPSGEAIDDAARRVLRLRGDAGELERRGVGEGHVPVVAADEDGAVLHVLVDRSPRSAARR